MKERPIIFSGPMVRAILEGRKTQTRRVVKRTEGNNVVEFRPIGDGRFEVFEDRYSDGVISSVRRFYRCPYGAPGHRLWVRETWQMVDQDGEADASDSLRHRLGTTAPFRGCQGERKITWRAVYRADGEATHPEYGPIVWRPSIHMPRWASRLTLEVKAVRVERLQEISEADAVAEGIEDLGDGVGKIEREKSVAYSTIHGLYVELWNSINAKRGYGWEANPWVWVIEFRRIEP